MRWFPGEIISAKSVDGALRKQSAVDRVCQKSQRSWRNSAASALTISRHNHRLSFNQSAAVHLEARWIQQS